MSERIEQKMGFTTGERPYARQAARCACRGAGHDRRCFGCGRASCVRCQPGGGGPCPRCGGPVWLDREPRPPGGRNPQLGRW